MKLYEFLNLPKDEKHIVRTHHISFLRFMRLRHKRASRFTKYIQFAENTNFNYILLLPSLHFWQ